MKIDAIVGDTIKEIKGMEKGSERIEFAMESGKKYEMKHYQNCCECVWLEDVCGDVKDLIGSRIVSAYESSTPGTPKRDTSATWTFYHIQSLRGCVTLRWVGESNGYYSESIDFEEITE